MGATRRAPQPYSIVMPLFTFLEKGIIAEIKATGLQIYFARAYLGRD